jgi:hypothetical protein
VIAVATRSSKAKPTPQQRAIEKKRARWRKARAAGHRWAAHRDPDTYDCEKEGQHFDRLSDDEWALVWKRVRAASPDKSLDEARVRRLVDAAALSSGWFVGFGGEIHFYRANYRQFADISRRFLKKVQTFRHELTKFFGAPPDGDWDPWEEYRRVVPLLDQLTAELECEVSEDEGNASSAENPANASEPKLDDWKARLVLIWQNECGLPIKNTKQLRGFLIDALQPYMRPTELTDTPAKYFIKRWLEGKVKNPGVQIFEFSEDK